MQFEQVILGQVRWLARKHSEPLPIVVAFGVHCLARRVRLLVAYWNLMSLYFNFGCKGTAKLSYSRINEKIFQILTSFCLGS